MTNIEKIFTEFPEKYVPGIVEKSLVYYFSIGDEKWTVFVDPEKCEAKRGKLVDNADCIVKSDPKLFENMVINKKMPGMMDIARGKIKTSDLNLLKKMADFFGIGK
jgi:putative sterol carrier protein